MQRVVSLLCVGLILPVAVAVPGVAEDGDVVTIGHIELANPAEFGAGLWSWSNDGPSAFTFDPAGRAGTWLATEVIDHGGAGYVVQQQFFDDSRTVLETECLSAPGSSTLLAEPIGAWRVHEVCLVPDDAVLGRVAAAHGVDLDVIVFVTSSPIPAPRDGILVEGHLQYPFGHVLTPMHIMFGPTGTLGLRAPVDLLTGQRLTAEVIDHGELGYQVGMRFISGENGSFTSASCQWTDESTGPTDEPYGELRQAMTCIVPDDAVEVWVESYYGYDLDVAVRIGEA